MFYGQCGAFAPSPELTGISAPEGHAAEIFGGVGGS